MNSGYRVEYTSDLDEVCIIPWPSIPCDDMIGLVHLYGQLGYKWWQVADERKGYIFTKKPRNIKPKEINESCNDRELDNQPRELHTHNQGSD